MKSKEKYIVPEHLLHVPLDPQQELQNWAAIEALKLFILESIEDKESRKEVENQLKELEKKCLKKIKENIAKEVMSKDYESKFTTPTSEKEEGGTTSIPAK